MYEETTMYRVMLPKDLNGKKNDWRINSKQKKN